MPSTYNAVDWTALPDWGSDNVAEALSALLLSCSTLKNQPDWQAACTPAAQLRKDDTVSARRYFEANFTPYSVRNAEGGAEGLVTGYYEPLLAGSRTPGKKFRYPLYGVPDDLLVVDLSDEYPELKGMRLRGRLQGKKIVPYYTRAEIERGDAAVRGRELLWVDDPIELFFLQVQGS
ncbi:MAG TPA: MltA domain-containing protein, partial [Burkholderiales bacterium]